MVSMSSTPHPLDPSVPAVVGGGKEEEEEAVESCAAAAATPLPPVGIDDEEEGPRRVRKPYTITKSRESWTDPEHDKFLEALQLFDRDWKKIEAYVGSKTVIQIRSHAQKYFLKVQKNGTGEHLPPPRPKRKAAHPYPHKSSKKALQVVLPQQVSHIMEQGCGTPMDVATVATDSSVNNAFPVQHFSPRHTQAMPDFARVYNFLGSIFDPETNGHLQKLKEMDPIDAETVLLLMKNLSINLTSPNFEEHRRLLSSDASSMDQKSGSSRVHLPFMITSK